MKAPPAPTWTDVMAGLIGLRLALYDDALRLGAIEVTGGTHRGPEAEAAADWLVERRLLVAGDLDGYLRAVPMSAAREQWEREGPQTRHQKTQPPPASQAPNREGRPVQAHQAQFFDLEGYA